MMKGIVQIFVQYLFCIKKSVKFSNILPKILMICYNDDIQLGERTEENEGKHS